MRDDIDAAITAALQLDRDGCQRIARAKFSWLHAWLQFKDNLVSHDG